MIYFIQAGSDGPIKIGKANNVARRLAVLQTASFMDLSVLVTAPGKDAHERALHRKFSAFRIRLEWFEPAWPLLGCIAQIRQSGVLPELELRNLHDSPAARVIDKCGGAAPVAEMTGVDVSRVHRWTYPANRGGTGGLIPSLHQQTILNAARSRGIALSPVDFFAEGT